MRKLLLAGACALALTGCASKGVSLITTRDVGQITYVSVALNKLAGPACPDAPAAVANEVRGIRAGELVAVAEDAYGFEYKAQIDQLKAAVLEFQAAIGRGVGKDTLEQWAAPAQLEAIKLLIEIIEEEHTYFFGAPSAISAARELVNKAGALTTRLARVKAVVLEACESRGHPVAATYFDDVQPDPLPEIAPVKTLPAS